MFSNRKVLLYESFTLPVDIYLAGLAHKKNLILSFEGFVALIGASLEELAENIMAVLESPLNYPLSNKDMVN